MTSRSPRFLSHATRTIAVVAALTLLAGCGEQSKRRQMPPTPVGISVVQPQSVPLIREATGRLSAYRVADVRARVSGVMLKRTYEEGTHVDEGQQLFQIDSAPLKATLNAAQASLAQTRATYKNAHIQAERAERLAPKGYISQSALDDARAAERTAAAAVQAAQAKVENARINLSYASVSSPISGRAGKQQVTVGALVGQGAATLLTTVRQVDPLYLNFSMPINKLQQLRVDQASGKASLSDAHKTSVVLKLPNGETYPHTGTVDFAGVSVDPTTGTVTLRALIPNPEHVLLPGMYANIKVNMGNRNGAFLIPQNAILRDADSAYVYVVGDGNKVARQNVTTDGQKDGTWIVTSGLSAGDKVIVKGVAKAKPGAEVKPTIVGSGKTAKGKSSAPAKAASTSSSPSADKGGKQTTAQS